MLIQVQKLRPDAILPAAGSDQAAGYDLFACIDAPIEIAPHTTERIGTGLAMAIPEGWFGAVFARSGLASREGLRPANCVGVCDSDYRGEYIVALHNDAAVTRTVNPGERIAQLVVLPCQSLRFAPCDALPETRRGDGGFGSTGK